MELGGAIRKIVLLIFQPTHFIVYQCETIIDKKTKIIVFLHFVSMEMAATLDFRALIEVFQIQ